MYVCCRSNLLKFKLCNDKIYNVYFYILYKYIFFSTVWHCYFYSKYYWLSLLHEYFIEISTSSTMTFGRLWLDWTASWQQLSGLSYNKSYRDSPSWDDTAKLDRMSKQRWEVICGSVQMETQTCILLQSSLGSMRKPPYGFIHGVGWKIKHR